MKQKKEEHAPKNIKSFVKLLFNAVVVTKKDVDVLDFIKNHNEFLAEPKNDNGCFMALRLSNCEFSKEDVPVKEKKIAKHDKLDKYLHFSFRGFRFIVDTEERTVQCPGAGLEHEMESKEKQDGLYFLHVETSD